MLCIIKYIIISDPCGELFEPERYIQYLELNGYRRTIVLNTTHAATKNPEIDIAARLFHL